SACRQKPEQGWVPCDADHLRIDLEKRPSFAVLSVASETAGAEPNRRDLTQPPLRGSGRSDRLANRAAEIVIRRRFGAAGDRRSIRIANAFGAMQGRAMHQEPEVPRVFLDNTMHGDKAANLLDRPEC